LSNGNEADISEDDDDENVVTSKLLKKAIEASKAERKKPKSNFKIV